AHPDAVDTMGAKVSAITNWDGLEIRFLSDERVQIRIVGKNETQNYGELGFEDKRTGKPNEAWKLLRTLAQSNGTVSSRTTGIGPWTKVEKRVQEIRQLLRRRYEISSDPLPFIDGHGYQAQFRISCARSYDT
ncbi:MAG: hypothetical protein ABI822_33390, partial [Bryobacteraceae bacterium]